MMKDIRYDSLFLNRDKMFGELEYGLVANGKLYKFIDFDGDLHYKETGYIINPDIPDGSYEFIGKMYQISKFGKIHDDFGYPKIIYEAEIQMKWERIK